jgi:dTMP kinase
LDGLDGAGKTTQLARLADWLSGQGRRVVRCHDPGGTVVGDQIRRLLLDTRSSMGMPCEMLLYMASRAQLVHEVIAPALAEGSVVLCDRFLLSTIVYQGHAGGMDVEQIRRVGEIATGGIGPDWTGVLDLDPRIAADRRGRPADRIEQRSADFHAKVRAGFLAEAAREPSRIRVIAALGDEESVHQRIVTEVRRVLDTVDRS